jgi:hypothetical protein
MLSCEGANGHLLILGAGPVRIEMAQAFQRASARKLSL